MGISRNSPSRWAEPAPEFELLYERFRLPIYRVVRGIVLDAAAAEELTQTVFDRAYAAWPRESWVDSPVWLFRTAVEVALSHLQGRWWSRLLLRHRVPFLAPRQPAALKSPAEQVLSALSPRLRALVVLSFYARLSNEEAGAAAGVPEALVSTQLDQAMKLMRGRLEWDRS